MILGKKGNQGRAQVLVRDNYITLSSVVQLFRSLAPLSNSSCEHNICRTFQTPRSLIRDNPLANANNFPHDPGVLCTNEKVSRDEDTAKRVVHQDSNRLFQKSIPLDVFSDHRRHEATLTDRRALYKNDASLFHVPPHRNICPKNHPKWAQQQNGDASCR